MKNLLLSLLPKTVFLYLLQFHFRLTNKKLFEDFQNLRKVETVECYSFKPFDDNKAIFVHIPKCAGVSINKTLFGNLAGGHHTLDYYLHRFEPRNINSYFKFTIVRNPWDRLVSAYHFLQKGGFGETDKDWFDEELSSYKDFNDFVINWVNHKNIFKSHHFRPQYHYMLDKRDKVKMDFVGFLENINEDFKFITTKIGIEKNLINSNKSNHLSYLDYYNEETIKIVSEIYAEDIKLLGYDFNNNNLSIQIENRNNGKIFSLGHPFV